MSNNADQKALAEFSGKKGEAYRFVISHKEDISRWIEEGWSLIAICRLLRSKGMLTAKYNSFRKAVKKVFPDMDNKTNATQLPKQQVNVVSQPRSNQTHRPQQQSRQQQFVTLTGVDHIGLDKKDE